MRAQAELTHIARSDSSGHRDALDPGDTRRRRTALAVLEAAVVDATTGTILPWAHPMPSQPSAVLSIAGGSISQAGGHRSTKHLAALSPRA